MSQKDLVRDITTARLSLFLRETADRLPALSENVERTYPIMCEASSRLAEAASKEPGVLCYVFEEGEEAVLNDQRIAMTLNGRPVSPSLFRSVTLDDLDPGEYRVVDLSGTLVVAHRKRSDRAKALADYEQAMRDLLAANERAMDALKAFRNTWKEPA